MSTTQMSTQKQTRDEHKTGFGIYVALIPWVLFAFIANHSSLKLAAVAAVAASGAIALPSLLNGRPKLLELGAIVAFAGFALVAFTADPATGDWVARYARAIAATLLSLIAFASLLFVPFTEQYARDSVPRRYWSSDGFRQINRRLTTMWALVFAAMVPAHVIAGALNTHKANLIFNWAIPVALIIWAAKRTAAASDDAGDAAR